ncbi:purine nucleoside phosphorylase LACC1 [Kryptolebias marmoratus]|uniref:Purine nucleoside phosphorylase LACC1 n=1 Tax=Kryptolebias marmoratus TaxID=37003 RepID=A0A3Q3BBC0_KRYMA|nr:purine nucleoside phosphorylase LACC1 [Kryptolebias marmoratus]
MAVQVDVIHGRCPACTAACLQLDSDSDSLVFVLCGDTLRGDGGFSEALLRPRSRAPILDSGSTVECLYRLKQSLDRLNLSDIRVFTTPRGQEELLHYQELLFTSVYSFDYKVEQLICPSCRGSTHTDSPGLRAQEDVSRFLQQLPALKGHVRVLKSTLIPECFGHGFSTRTGGVSYIPTLSSLNLFSSSKRRDPRAVVMENKRRLALHAGFHPLPLCFVKVNHANEVWVFGEAEPDSYDSIVSNQTGVVLTAPGADCMPILFADPVKKVIGAAHAGWKGTLMGVAMATVNAMVANFGCQVSDIVVAVGPSVGVCCFMLDREQALDFTKVHPDCVPDPESAKPHVDIRLANRVLLQKGGVLPGNIHDNLVKERPPVTPCTSCHPEDYFSHVRDGLNFGTQVGFLWIKEAAEQTAPTET